MNFRTWIEGMDEYEMELKKRITDDWPVARFRYDLNDPEDRKRYEDDRKEAIAALISANKRKVVSERLVREPYTITCWRGFNGFSYDRDVSRKGEKIFIDSSKAMNGILWFAHSLQSTRHLDGLSPEEFALTYAKDHDEKYLLRYPLKCTMAYKSVNYNDGQEYVEFAEDLGTEWTRIGNKSYLLPKGWFITWQNQEYMAFNGILEIDRSMLERVTT